VVRREEREIRPPRLPRRANSNAQADRLEGSRP